MRRKTIKKLLFPPIIFRIALIPLSIISMQLALKFPKHDTVSPYISYIVAAYTVAVWGLQLPKLFKAAKHHAKNNKYIQKISQDVRLRINVSLFFSFLWNSIYAVFQFVLGIQNSSAWYFSFSVYFACLAVLRFFLLRYTREHSSCEDVLLEFKKIRVCGCVLLLITWTLAAVVFLMVYYDKVIAQSKITAIAMATYTFASFIIAIVNVVKYRKYGSPVYDASKILNLVAANVSMLTLSSTLLTVYGTPEDVHFRQIMLGSLGSITCLWIIITAISMIANSTKKIKKIKNKSR